MIIAYNAYCLFLFSLLIIVFFNFLFRCYHYLVNKDVYNNTIKLRVRRYANAIIISSLAYYYYYYYYFAALTVDDLSSAYSWQYDVSVTVAGCP